jgi:hypothetical protein
MPMALKALTGLFTAPGIIFNALPYNVFDLFLFISSPQYGQNDHRSRRRNPYYALPS